MRSAISTLAIGLFTLAGCSNDPAPARVSVPEQPTITAMPRVGKPMPAPSRDDLPAPPFDDVPLVSQQAPETPAFVQAYNAVGRPRVCVFVNRTLQGDTIPVTPRDPLLSVEHERTSSAGVTADRNDSQTQNGVYDTHARDRSDHFESRGPSQYKETTSVYLRPDQYDEAAAKSLDYEAVENILTDFLSADNQVTIMSPTLVRQKMTADQVKDLESGQPQVASQIAQQLGADVLIQVAAHPTRQTAQGLEVRLVCEAMNIKGGQSIGRVVVDVPPPLEKTQINKFTRFCARKLMRDMTNTWNSPAPSTPGSAAPAAPVERPQTPAPAADQPAAKPPATLPTKP